MKDAAERSAFSRRFDVHTVPDGGLETSIEATTAECIAIAEAIGVSSVGELRATFRIDKRSNGRLQVEGTAQARIVQTCVVTLDPFPRDIEAPIDLMFAPLVRSRSSSHPSSQSRRRSRRTEPEEPARAPLEQMDDDPPDPIVDGAIDLGAVAVEFLTLALDVYPRRPGAQFSDVVTGATRPIPSAFAALERLKDHS